MYTEIPSLTRCCFCAPLQYGLMVWAYLKLVFNIFVFSHGFIWLSEFVAFMILSEYAKYILLLLTSLLLLFLSDIIFSFLLIIGIHKKHTTLLRLFFRFGIVHAVLFVTIGLMIISFVLTTTDEIHRDETLHFLVVFSSIWCSFIILQMYLLLLVRSEILKLKIHGQFQFVNHTADPKCIMQDVDFVQTDKGMEILTEKP